MSKLHRHLSIAVLLSEFSHVFCCILPTLFTVLSFAANLGLITTMPGFLLDIHEHIHEYEVPIIIVTGVMLALGWLAHVYSRKVDCHDDGCCHPPCTPQKSMNAKILIIASVLFALNISVYAFVHRNVLSLPALETVAVEHHDHDHEHDGH
jgi:hypothetical protein